MGGGRSRLRRRTAPKFFWYLPGTTWPHRAQSRTSKSVLDGRIDSFSLLSPGHSLSPLFLSPIPAHWIAFWTADIAERVPHGQYPLCDCPKYKPRTMEEVQADYQLLTYSTYIKKVAVSPEDFGIIAINSGRLCFFKLGGDQKWILVDSSNNRYHDIVYRKGKYYAVDYGGRTVVIDGVDLKKVKVTASPLPGLGACQFTRLVESGDDLFLVYRFLDPVHEAGISTGAVTMGMVTEESHPGMPNYFNVYKLDEENKQWQLVDDLNHQVFFLGDDYLFSVSAQDFPGLKGNCIYFSDCMFRARNEKEANIGKSCVLTGVYNLKDRSCGPLAVFPEHWPIFSPPPAWLKLKHCEGMMEGMNEDQLQRDAAALKQDMPEPTPEAKKIAAEAKFRGDDAYRRKDYLVALDAYTQAIGFDPSDATLFSNRSVCWIRLDKPCMP